MELLLVVFWLSCGFFAATVASGKGHDWSDWFIFGCFFGPIALTASVGLEDRKLRRYIRLLGEHQGIKGETFEPVEEKPAEKPSPARVQERKPRDPNKPRTVMDRLEDFLDPDRTSRS